MLLQTILEGLGLGALLAAVCAVGIRKGAVGMVHLYDQTVQERCIVLGLTTKERIKRNALCFKAICIPIYLAYVLLCVCHQRRTYLLGRLLAVLCDPVRNTIPESVLLCMHALLSGSRLPRRGSRRFQNIFPYFSPYYPLTS